MSSSYGGNGLIDHTHPLNSLNMGLNPGPPGGSSRGSSPGPSPSQRRRPHHQLVNLQLRSPSHGHSSQNHSQNQSSVSFNLFYNYCSYYIVRTNTQSEVEAWYYGKYHVVVQYAATCVLYAVRFFFIISRIFVSFFICLYLLLAVVRCAEPFNRALKLHEFQASAFLKGSKNKAKTRLQGSSKSFRLPVNLGFVIIHSSVD